MFILYNTDKQYYKDHFESQYCSEYFLEKDCARAYLAHLIFLTVLHISLGQFYSECKTLHTHCATVLRAFNAAHGKYVFKEPKNINFYS
jgi:hypothetical protein